METYFPMTIKPGKWSRARRVLLGVVELYLKTGKPIGSNTLRDSGFEDLSSATIRNYFAQLEEEGLLHQQHISGGRIPTAAAFRLYASEYLDQGIIDPAVKTACQELSQQQTREVAAFLGQSINTLGHLVNAAVFITAPRFDSDFITTVRLMPLDTYRCLCALITDFGLVQTEVIPTTSKLSNFAAKRIENYFKWRLSGLEVPPPALIPEEEQFAQKVYNELMVRHAVRYLHFNQPDIYRGGFARLLSHPDFSVVATLASSLALFENNHSLQLLGRECLKSQGIKFWIEEDLLPYSLSPPSSAIIAIPYSIGTQPAGILGILVPVRSPYRQLFGTLHAFSEAIGTALTQSIYKFKISFRQPQAAPLSIPYEEQRLLEALNSNKS